jgi:hypothetical protein
MRIKKRWWFHKSKENPTNSKDLLERHGVDNCKFVVLEVCPLEERREKEQWWLDHSVGAVNKFRVIRNEEQKKAYNKEWKEINKERYKQQRKAQYEAKKASE